MFTMQSSEKQQIIGDSKVMHKLYETIAKVAPLNTTVLLYGESGTGKELAARAVHQLSNRHEGPFLPVNCGALPSDLLNTELFGHERGSFTGATRQHRGYFERASGGTLFLDEITEMPLNFQVHLLRALETGAFIRVGGCREIATDVRFIAATNIDPWEAVEAGKLRHDLFFRLMEFPVLIPPLRKRGNDIFLLAQHFLNDFNKTHSENKHFTSSALQFIKQNDWQGNVRELRNAVHHAFILAEEKIDQKEFHEGWMPGKSCCKENFINALVGSSIEEVERNLILATLEHFTGDKKQAAECLGISLKTLYNRLNDIKGMNPANGEGDLKKVVNFFN